MDASGSAEVIAEDRPRESGGLFRGVLIGLFLIPWTMLWGTVTILAAFVKSASLFQTGVGWWSRGILALGGIKLDIRYDVPLDTSKQYVFLSNHQSALDIPALILATAKTHDVRFMAKESLFKVPFMGWGMSRNGFVPIRRESARAAAEMFQEILNDKSTLGYSYLIFPEGTRSPDGRLQPIKRGTLGLAMRLGRPVVPVTLIDASRANPKNTYAVRSGTIGVRFHAPIDIPAEGADRTFRDALSDQVYEAIRAPLPPEQQPLAGANTSPAAE